MRTCRPATTTNLLPSLLLLLLFATASPAYVLRLPSGKTVSAKGKGPPVAFSTGLYNTMPSFLYGRLLSELRKNLTVVTLDASWTPPLLDEACSRLGVARVGLMTHSSFDARLLESPRLQAAVVCDPVSLPRLGGEALLSPSLVHASCPVLDLRAGEVYEEEGTGIPSYLSPLLADEEAYSRVVLDGFGHADLLDDVYAEAGTRALPWMRGVRARRRDEVPFSEWFPASSGSPPSSPPSKAQARDAYRKEVAALAVRHLCEA